MAIEESGLMEEKGNEHDSDEESVHANTSKKQPKTKDVDNNDLNMDDFDDFENQMDAEMDLN